MARGVIDVDDEHPEHPLFPLEEDERAPDISYIHVTRWEKGKQVYATKLFSATELTTLEQIQELFGGGDYILIGRNASKSNPGQPGSRMTKHRKVNISGAPKPMSDNPTDEELNGGHRVAPPQAGGGLMGGADGILLAILNMNATAQQAAEARAERAAKEAADASKQFMMMFLELMKGNKSDAAQMTQMMMTMSQNQTQSMMAMVTSLLSTRGGGPEEMSKMVELLKGLGMNIGGKENDKEKDGFSMEDLPSMIENVADIATAAVQLRSGNGPMPPNGQNQAPQIAPSDGSAASVAAAMGLGKP